MGRKPEDNKQTGDFRVIIDQLDLIGIYRTFYKTVAEYTFF
jgi:hypothetical protein